MLIMLLLYYIVNFINYIVYLNLHHLNKIYLNFNKFNLVFKKPFNKITFLEKFILSFFYKTNWFFKSISNFSNYNDEIVNYKRKNHPLLNFFSLYNNLTDNKITDLFFLKKMFTFFKKNKFLKKYTFVDFLIFQTFLNKKYFNLLNKNYFKNLDNFNLIKLDFLFVFFNKKISSYKSSYKNYKYNLNYYNDWFLYLFNNFNKFDKIKFDKTEIINLKKKKFDYMLKTIKLYSVTYKFDKLFFYKKNNFFSNFYVYINFYFNKLNTSFFKKINLNKFFFDTISKKLPIRFNNSSVNKYINFNNLTNYSFFYLRKNKIFNKSRYSRNRQLYRTGVYWCLWLNILIVYGLYFFFYRFSFNFGYLWFGLAILIFSTIFSRILKYKLYNIYNLFNEFIKLYLWFGFILKNFILNYKNFITNYKFSNNLNLILFNKFNYIFYIFYKYFNKFLINFSKKKDYGYVFIWENYTSEDKSFLKYKSILNWFVQLYKVLTY